MEEYEAPSMEIVELEGSIVTFGINLPDHGQTGGASASC